MFRRRRTWPCWPCRCGPTCMSRGSAQTRRRAGRRGSWPARLPCRASSRSDVLAGLLDLSIPELAERVRSGEASAERVALESLARIDATQALGAFLHVAREATLRTARAIDERRARGAT